MDIVAVAKTVVLAAAMVLVVCLWAYWDTRARDRQETARRRKEYYEGRVREARAAVLDILETRAQSREQWLAKTVALNCAQQLYRDAQANLDAWEEMERHG